MLLGSVPNLVAVLPDGRPECAGRAVAGVAFHSARVRPGFCFVAVRGARDDGHRFVESAVARGASAIVVDRPEVARAVARRPEGLCVALVTDSRLALAWMAAAFFGHPSRDLAVVGITGTVGKTSTALFLQQILNGAGRLSGAVGSLGILTRHHTAPSPLTTPDAVTLQAALRTMADEGLACSVVEVSSHALMQSRAAGLRLSAGVLTELLPHEHADAHPTFRHYLATKARFLELLEPGATLAYSTSSAETVALASRWPGKWRIRYALLDGGPAGAGDGGHAPASGEGERGCVEGRILSMSLSGVELALAAHLDGQRPPAVRVHLPLIGPHAASNAVASAAAALALGVNFERVVAGLSRLTPPWRRMEPTYRGEFTVIDDTTGHPASFERLFRTLEASAAPSVVLLVGIRGSRGAEINARNGQVIARWSHRLPVKAMVVTDSLDVADELNRVRDEERHALLSALQDARVQPIHCPALEDAVAAAVNRTSPGDVLVLAGAQGLNRAAEMVRALLRSR